jgi:hypothetical protein
VKINIIKHGLGCGGKLSPIRTAFAVAPILFQLNVLRMALRAISV